MTEKATLRTRNSSINITHALCSPRLSLMLLRWQWLAFHLSKKDAWVIPNVFFSETFANLIVVYTIFCHRLKIQS